MFNAILEGRLSREVRIGGNNNTGSKVTNLTIAVDMSTQTKKVTQFFDVACWNELADEASKLVKGQAVKVKINSLKISTTTTQKKGGKVGEMMTFINAQCNAEAIKAGALPRAIQNHPATTQAQAPELAQTPMAEFGQPIDFSDEIPF